MPPLTACFPICTTLFALGLLAVAMILAGYGRARQADPVEGTTPAAPVGSRAAQLWSVLLFLLGTALLLGALTWVNWGN
jgi:hypothetical protein